MHKYFLVQSNHILPEERDNNINKYLAFVYRFEWLFLNFSNHGGTGQITTFRWRSWLSFNRQLFKINNLQYTAGSHQGLT